MPTLLIYEYANVLKYPVTARVFSCAREKVWLKVPKTPSKQRTDPNTKANTLPPIPLFITLWNILVLAYDGDLFPPLFF